MQCRIKWIDNEGRPTPDQREAIGEVYVEAHIAYGSMYLGGQLHCEESARYPICAEHLKRFHAEHLSRQYWRFVSFPISDLS